MFCQNSSNCYCCFLFLRGITIYDVLVIKMSRKYEKKVTIEKLAKEGTVNVLLCKLFIGFVDIYEIKRSERHLLARTNWSDQYL